jgi:F0F1-type ATP synthase membrane subunit c/vacuolar-type H+-ATPase subunit K
MWDQPTTRTIKVPKLQTIFLVVLLVAAATAIVWVSIAIRNEMPRPPAPTPPPEGPAAWLSAWSTFWSAIAGGLAAIGTAGALLIAAFSYKHQVDEKNRQAEERRRQAREIRRDEENMRRAQAMQVSILTPASQVHINHVVLQVHNGSTMPIRNVLLRCFNHSGQDSGQKFQQVIAGGMTHDMFEQNRRVLDTVWASFEDASGQKWKVHVNGELEEL